MRIGTRLPNQLNDVRRYGGRVKQDERLISDVFNPDPFHIRQRVILREQQVGLDGQQRQRADIRPQARVIHERDVNLAREQFVLQVVVIPLNEVHVDRRAHFGKTAQHVRNHCGSKRHIRPHRERPAHFREVIIRDIHNLLGEIEHLLCLRIRDPARRGQREAVRLALDAQLRPREPVELRQRHRNRRRGHVQESRCLADCARLRRRHEMPQLTEGDPRISTKVHGTSSTRYPRKSRTYVTVIQNI